MNDTDMTTSFPNTSFYDDRLHENITPDSEDEGYILTNHHLYLLKQSFNMERYMSPTLIIGGTLCNMLSIVILRSAHFRNASSTLMMIVLAVMDTFNLNVGLLRLWVKWRFNIKIRLLNTAACKLHLYATYVFSGSCAWSLVLLTVERSISVMFPLAARRICSRSRMGKAMLITLTVLILSYIYLPILLKLKHLQRYDTETQQVIYYKRCDIRFEHKQLAMDVLYWQDILLTCAIPSCLIFICNTLIAYTLTKAHIKRQKQMHVTSKNQTSTGSVTSMLTIVSLMFLITTLPINVYFLQRDVWFDYGTVDGVVNNHFTFTLVNMLYYSNNTMNFLLYFTSGRKFRKAFRDMFFICLSGQIKETTATSRMTVSETTDPTP